jgi:hypothetical protein
MKPVEYGPVFMHPAVVELDPALKPRPLPRELHPVWQHVPTRHEGTVLYYKLWNFWARAGAAADLRAELFFRDYERANPQTDALLRDAGFPWRKAETEEEIWERIGAVWRFLHDKVDVDNAAYATLTSVPGTWPSILDFAAYYAAHGRLVWAACFSKAHLFATLLGRVVYPRFRFGIATAHHTEGGAPPTASHVYVGAYVAERWFHLDATAAPFTGFAAFAERRSIGVASFTSVDYPHPFEFIPVPLSGFANVPLLPE